MHLKRLEVENFKSFMGEMVIPFERGFTAITGPNGSGKSNSGDAVQFVLGPRSSKSLRAGNVKDLIFNGGKNKKPAKKCSVTLVFDNPVINGKRRMKIDLDEVKFTRVVRITSGKNSVSAYYLNGEASSQRQFRMLLAEANARADGYNIVLQGDVTNLATCTSTKRRRTLDDVAGVTSYDEEIRKADRQRKRVEEYLERISLLEEEFAIRLKGLKKEREQALKYQQLKIDLDEAKTMLMRAKHRSRFEEIQFISEERNEYLKKAEEINKSRQDGEKELLELDTKIADIERQVTELVGEDSALLMERINNLRLDIDRRKDKIEEAGQTIVEIQESLEYLGEENEDAVKALDTHITGLEDAKQSLKSVEKAFKDAEKAQTDARGAILAGDKEKNELSRRLGLANQNVSEMASKLTAVQLNADRAEQALDLALEQLATIQEEVDEFQLARDDLKLLGEELKEGAPKFDRTELSQQIIDKQRAEKQLTEEAEAVENKLRETERSVVRARAEMENRSGSKAGMALAVKSLLERRDRGEQRGILGTISELAAPSDSSHEEALATAIGGAMNSVVVENDEVAAECIGWLRQNKIGRATFLPLNKLQDKRSSGKSLMVSRQDGVMGFAWELLECDERIQLAIKYVLRDTLLVRDLATARKHMGGVRMVTLTGSVTEAGGAMSGGSSNRNRPSFGGKIAGANEVEKLQKELNRLQLLSDTVNAALSESRREQRELNQRIANLSNDDFSLKQKQWKEDLRIAEERLSKSIGKGKEAQKKVDGLKIAKEDADLQLANSANEAEMAEKERIAANEALQIASPEHLQKKLREAEELRLDSERIKAQATGQLAGGEEHTEILKARVNELNKKIEQSNNEIKEKKDGIKTWKEEILVFKEELEKAEGAHSQVTEEHKELEDQRVQLREDRGSLRSNLGQMAQQVESMENRSRELTHQLEVKRTSMAELVTEMKELNIKPAPPDVEVKTVQQAENSVKGLERRMENIGNVNMLSIEQYDSAEERVKNLKEDNKTLTIRRKQLIGIAESLEKQRKKRLLAVLKEVNANFKEVYNKLTKGKAELRLENPSEPFNGGLEMWCQPPGKSARSRLEALSGGEKSMAALALIFAIQDYDPSPFYYFDEVDQNLDAFNAERIAQLCRQRSARAQFIMVTLRKVSLQLADHHIGITHAGDGCSRRIANFDKDKAIEVGEAALAENKAMDDRQSAMRGRMGELPTSDDMPNVPEEIETPTSLGGTISKENLEQGTDELSALKGRAEEMKEEIVEHQEYREKIEDAIAEENSTNESEHEEILEQD